MLPNGSAQGLVAVVSQALLGGEHPVTYTSQKLTPADQRYSVIERETVAVKWAVETLQYYLWGVQFSCD